MATQKMKAWRLHQFGIEHLHLDDIAIPQPGPNDLLIRVNAVSINYRDKAIVDGVYNPDILEKGPITLASDASGTVVALGTDVTRFREGDKVITQVYTRWLDGERTPDDPDYLLGSPLAGVLSEYIVINEAAAVAKPEYLTDEEAATLPIAALTAWNAITTVGNIRKGQTIFIQGTGGVALFSVQIAAALDAKVIISTSQDEKGIKAMSLGAHHFINYHTQPDWELEVLKLTGGTGADEIVELVAGDITRSVKAIKFGGTIAIIGFLDHPQLTVNVFSLFAKQPNIVGLSIGHRRSFEEMNAFFEQHQIRPMIDGVYDFANAAEAFRHLSKGPFGKIVIKIS
ncbi:NADPH:quinone reductase [Chitinophaga sp. YR627]|uniref:zinc-dependent alcohol dehydrogenase family protein n=1 Tax=Chitinophaga sp. YR627 TaxID=1881041 RepID=UPI0008EC03E4|nr:NAD(P)-dependent alcohol dehydrogenase [Chitinophaga sp. YR627]SFO90110.1 NADPH:quinone reductase [Chitinophaga sp. YR627]